MCSSEIRNIAYCGGEASHQIILINNLTVEQMRALSKGKTLTFNDASPHFIINSETEKITGTIGTNRLNLTVREKWMLEFAVKDIMEIMISV